nr:AAA family ATPase [bacterium]
MGAICAIANQKGGVGKTTTAVNLAAGLAQKGRKVLLIDLDPQGNATSSLAIDKGTLVYSVYDALIGRCPADQACLNTQVQGLDIMPCNLNLAGAEVELVDVDARETVLKCAIAPLKANYQDIIIDCPPSLSLLTVNALTAADRVLVPIQCEFFALEGLTQLMGSIKLVKQRFNPQLSLYGVVLTMFDARTNLSIQVVDEVKKFFTKKVFRCVIPRNVRLAEAPSHGLSIYQYEPRCQGAESYRALVEEYVSRETKGG